MTKKQQEVFDFIIAFQLERGYPPSRKEMSVHFGVAVNAIVDRMRYLERDGHIAIDKGISRGIRIL